MRKVAVGILSILAMLLLSLATQSFRIRQNSAIADKVFLIDASERGHWGFIDHAGVAAVDPNFNRASDFHCGRAFVVPRDDKQATFGLLLDHAGKKVSNKLFVGASNFKENLSVASACEYSLSDGFDADSILKALSNARRQKTFVDLTGKMRLGQFERCTSFEEGRAVVQKSGRFQVIDKLGTVKSALDLANIGESWGNGLLAACQKPSGPWGFIDNTGRFVIAPAFESVEPFHEGLAAVRLIERQANTLSLKWGYIDTAGKFTVKPKFQFVNEYSEGLALVREGTWQGYIDKSGHKTNVSNNLYRDFHEGLVAFMSEGKCGFKNKANEIQIRPQFLRCGDFSEGLACAQVETAEGPRVGFVNVRGDWAIPPRFIKASNFSEHLAAVCFADKR